MLILISVSLYLSCAKDKLEPKRIIVSDTISFKNDIIPIFQSCYCHQEGNTSIPDYSADSLYNTLISDNLINKLNPNSSSLYHHYSGNTLLYFTSVIADTIIINKWIRQGEKNN